MKIQANDPLTCFFNKKILTTPLKMRLIAHLSPDSSVGRAGD